MQAAERAQIEEEAPPGGRERPWLFSLLAGPASVIAIGLVSGALAYLLRSEGVDPGRGASIVALLTLPHTIYFLWGPATDFWMRRRTWLMVAAAAAAATLAIAFQQGRLAAPWAIGLLFLSACLGEFTVAACGGMMGTLRSEINRRRAGSFYQSGSLAFGALAVFAMVSLAHRLSLGTLGLILAAMVALPAVFALAAPEQAEFADHKLGETGLAKTGLAKTSVAETAERFWREFKATFLRWEAIPYTLLITFPMCSGAMIGLLPALAADYGVTGRQVAWINGVAGALLMVAGALLASLVPVRVRAPIAYLLAGLANAAALAVLALGPLRAEIYFAGTVLYLFTVGACYALFTGVVLEFLGDSGKSGSSRYAIINSLGNIPVAYMAYLDGRSYAHWGPRAMPGMDAVLSAAGAALLLAHFVVSRRKKG